MGLPKTTICLVALAIVFGHPCDRARADCPGAEITLHAGLEDEFALPPEPTAPSPELLSYMEEFWPQPPTRQFDTPGNDLALIHTFTGWSGPVCGAMLKIRLAAQSSGLSSNDGIWLSLVGGTDLFHAFHYWTTIANVTGSWGPGSVATVVLDLSALPPFYEFPTNILDVLSDGSLELLVEDDTAVDSAALQVCPCPVAIERTSWGRVKTLYRGLSGGEPR
jgi:hypothetical protein